MLLLKNVCINTFVVYLLDSKKEVAEYNKKICPERKLIAVAQVNPSQLSLDEEKQWIANWIKDNDALNK